MNFNHSSLIISAPPLVNNPAPLFLTSTAVSQTTPYNFGNLYSSSINSQFPQATIVNPTIHDSTGPGIISPVSSAEIIWYLPFLPSISTSSTAQVEIIIDGTLG